MQTSRTCGAAGVTPAARGSTRSWTGSAATSPQMGSSRARRRPIPLPLTTGLRWTTVPGASGCHSTSPCRSSARRGTPSRRPAAYHFDHPAVNTFDPTSAYYPSYMTQDWILSHVGTPEEAAIGDRCHLATSSAFTAPMDTPVSSGGDRRGRRHRRRRGRRGHGDRLRLGDEDLEQPLHHVSGGQDPLLVDRQHLQPDDAGFAAIRQGRHVGVGVLAPTATPSSTASSCTRTTCASPAAAAAPRRRASPSTSPEQDVRFLTALCAKNDETSSFPQMKLFAIGGTKPYSCRRRPTTSCPR